MDAQSSGSVPKERLPITLSVLPPETSATGAKSRLKPRPVSILATVFMAL